MVQLLLPASIPNANAKIYYEARIKLADIGSTTVQAFAGLSEIDQRCLLQQKLFCQPRWIRSYQYDSFGNP